MAQGFKPAQGTVRTIVDNRAIIVLRGVTDSNASTLVTAVREWPKSEATSGCDTNKDSPR
jgi:hypothetical protein